MKLKGILVALLLVMSTTLVWSSTKVSPSRPVGGGGWVPTCTGSSTAGQQPCWTDDGPPVGDHTTQQSRPGVPGPGLQFSNNAPTGIGSFSAPDVQDFGAPDGSGSPLIPVPEPASLLLVVAGLSGLGWMRHRK